MLVAKRMILIQISGGVQEMAEEGTREGEGGDGEEEAESRERSPKELYSTERERERPKRDGRERK